MASSSPAGGSAQQSAKSRSGQDAIDEADAVAVAALAKALAHPARVKALQVLMQRENCIGCDIVDALGLAPSTTSEHLRILKSAGLVVGEFERPRVCYSLDVEAIAPLRAFLDALISTAPPTRPPQEAGGEKRSDAADHPGTEREPCA